MAKKAINLEIGARLREAREQLGFQQSHVAEKAGVKSYVIRDYELGASGISSEVLQVLLSEFGINLNWLLSGEGETYAKNEAGVKLKKAKQGLGKEHEPELVGNLSDMPEFNKRVIDIEDLETLESLITKIKGQTNANPKGT